MPLSKVTYFVKYLLSSCLGNVVLFYVVILMAMAVKKMIDGSTKLSKAVMCASHHHIHIFTKEKDLAKCYARIGVL